MPIRTIEIDKLGLFNYVVIERGAELKRNITSDLDELLYLIFSFITFEMACDYEVKNRVLDKDFRRMMFNKQEELLGILKRDWQERKSAEHQKILSIAPFTD